MTQQASRMNGALIKVFPLAAAILFVACRPTPPPTPPPQPPTPTVEIATAPIVTPGPTTRPGYAPGSIVLQEASNVTTDSRAEFTFESVAMQVIRLDANLIGGTADYEVRLADKFGNFLVSLQSSVGRTTGTIAEFTLPYEGTYTVIVIGLGGSGTVQVAVTALGPPSGGGELEAGGAISGLMSTARVYHTYQFALTEGQVVTIGAAANVSGAPDTSLVLYGPDGRYVAHMDDLAPPNDLDAVLSGYVVPQTGIYTAIVTNYGDAIGNYIFSISLDTETPQVTGEPDIVYDKDYRAAFYDQSVLNVTFDGVLGEVLQISVFDPEPEVDIDIVLYSPFGQAIAFARDALKGDGEVINEVQLPYTGRYRLELSPIGSGQASFRVSLLMPDALTGGGSFGDNSSGSFPGFIQAPNVFHFYQFNGAAGNKITVTITEASDRGQLDLGFALIGPNGLEVPMAFADDPPELSDFELAQTGTYTIIVYHFSADATGSYTIQFVKE